jgi:hypothetical protein
VAIIILPISTGFLKRKRIARQRSLEKAITNQQVSGFLFKDVA